MKSRLVKKKLPNNSKDLFETVKYTEEDEENTIRNAIIVEKICKDFLVWFRRPKNG